MENRTQNILMNMVINVYEYGRGGKFVYKFRHTYTGIREMRCRWEKSLGIFAGLCAHQ